MRYACNHQEAARCGNKQTDLPGVEDHVPEVLLHGNNRCETQEQYGVAGTRVCVALPGDPKREEFSV
jgi:hypothetical protein